MIAELDLARPLSSLTTEELDHVSLGLTHAFGASLAGDPGDDGFFLTTEGGLLVALSKSLTLSDLWSVANKTCTP